MRNNLLRLLVKYHFILMFVVFELVAVLLIVSYNSFHNAKIYQVKYAVSGSINNRLKAATKYLELENQNKLLVSENARLYNSLPLSVYSYIDSTLLDTTASIWYNYMPARVISNTVNKQYNFITLNKGQAHGVEADMGVVGPNGLVGVVKGVSTHFSSVLPMLNRDFSVQAMVAKSGYFGYITWPGNNYQEVVLNHIPRHADISIGDSVVTKGNSDIYPEAIFIGTITDYTIDEGTYYKVKVKLSTDFKKLNHVMVIKNFLKEEQRELELSVEND